MEERRRGPRILLLVGAALMLAAVVLLYVTAPPTTTLTVRVVGTETEEAVAGAVVQVQAPSEQALPAAVTDEGGIARFRDIPPDAAYEVRVQAIDHDLTFAPPVAVPRGEETEITVPVAQRAGGRLFVGLYGARVAVVDTASLLTLQTFRLPGSSQDAVSHVRLHRDEEMLYAIAGEQGWILDSVSGTVLRQLQLGRHPDDVGLSSDERNLLALAYEGGGPAELAILDASAGGLLTSTQTANPMTATQVFWSPDGGPAYLVDPSTRSLRALEREVRQVLERTETGAHGQQSYLSADGQYRYTWSAEPFAGLQETYLTDLRPVPRLRSLPRNSAAWSLSAGREELYVLDYLMGTLSIVDLTGQGRSSLVAVGKYPAAVVVSRDGEWAFVANQGSRTVSAIYLPTRSVLHSIALPGAPFSLALR